MTYFSKVKKVWQEDDKIEYFFGLKVTNMSSVKL